MLMENNIIFKTKHWHMGNGFIFNSKNWISFLEWIFAKKMNIKQDFSNY